MRTQARLLMAITLTTMQCSWLTQGGPSAVAAEPATPSMQYTYQGRPISEQQYQALTIFNDSLADLQQSRWTAAEAKLRKAIALDPTMYQAHSNLSIVLIRTGRIDEAQQEADKASQLEPNKPETVSAQAGLLQAKGHLEEAAKLYDEFAKRFPTHAMARQAKAMSAQLQVEAKTHKAVERDSKLIRADNDYFAYVTHNSVAKWTADRMPLKVYVPTDSECSAASGYRSEFGEGLRAAFHDWEAASQDAVKIQFVPDAEKANIECKWTANFADVQQPTEGGEANVIYDPINGIRHVKIILLTRMPATGMKDLAPNMVKTSCLHEVGHSLGLIEHSPKPGDIMYCSEAQADRAPQLSERDINTLRHLYRSDVQLAHNYHDQVDPSDKAALNNEGIKYASNREYDKAAAKFEAALKIDPKCEPARRNLSSCLNNLGIAAAKEGRLDEAATTFQRALELEGPNGDPKKLISIMQNLVFVYGDLKKTKEADDVRARLNKLTSAGNATGVQAK